METEKIASQFVEGLQKTNRSYNYYIDWNNVLGLDAHNIEFHAMDSLIKAGEKFDTKFRELLKKLPTVITIFPLLFALSKVERNEALKGKTLLNVLGGMDNECYQEYDFSENKAKDGFSDGEIGSYLDFFKQMGLKRLYQEFMKKSTTDYVLGVLVGLDSNGRKNRGGHAFELACEPMIREVSEKLGFEVMAQKKISILRRMGMQVSEDISNRKADFLLFRRKDRACVNIEVNFYNGTGSKPEEIIDSYINRQRDLNKDGINFVLITDGQCWRKSTNQLSKGLRNLSALMNYRMCKDGALYDYLEAISGFGQK